MHQIRCDRLDKLLLLYANLSSMIGWYCTDQTTFSVAPATPHKLAGSYFTILTFFFVVFYCLFFILERKIKNRAPYLPLLASRRWFFLQNSLDCKVWAGLLLFHHYKYLMCLIFILLHFLIGLNYFMLHLLFFQKYSLSPCSSAGDEPALCHHSSTHNIKSRQANA